MEQTITLPIISGYTAALLGIMQATLMMTVGFARRSTGVSLGDDGNALLLLKIRRHGNLVENAAIFLILLSLLEVIGGTETLVLSFASIFVVARLSHAYALSKQNIPNFPRGIGAMGTFIGIAGTAAALVWQLSMVH